MDEERDLALDPNAAKEARAEVAFKDYLLMAPQRSVGGLLKEYQEKSRTFGRGAVPTTNRTTIFEWSKQYRWAERAAEHDKRVAQADAKSYDMLRTLRFDNLFELSDGAIKAMRELIEDSGTRADVRLKAAQTVLDRIGVTENLIQHAEPAQKKADVPDPEASDEVLQEWLAGRRR